MLSKTKVIKIMVRIKINSCVGFEGLAVCNKFYYQFKGSVETSSRRTTTPHRLMISCFQVLERRNENKNKSNLLNHQRLNYARTLNGRQENMSNKWSYLGGVLLSMKFVTLLTNDMTSISGIKENWLCQKIISNLKTVKKRSSIKNESFNPCRNYRGCFGTPSWH